MAAASDVLVDDVQAGPVVELGVLQTPAVAFDGRVVLSGHIPESEEIKKLLDLA